MGVYPQHTKRSPFRVNWAHLTIHQMEDDYREIAETDDDGQKSSLLDQRYAALAAGAAKNVDLARLADRNEGVLLRFVSYAENKTPTFFEERILPCEHGG